MVVMKQKPSRAVLNRYAISLFVLLVVFIAVITLVWARRDSTEALPAAAKPATSAKSQFSFSGTSGWHQGPTNGTSMALFSNDHSCFASIEHKTGAVDIAAELQKNQDNISVIGGTSMPGAVLTATLQVGAGKQQYDLHQYSESGASGGKKLMGGLQLGYIQLLDGYLKIEGHCNTADELPTTIPALQAIKFTD